MDLKELFSSKYADSSKLLQAYADLIKYADQRNIRKTEIVINKLYNMNIDADSLISALIYLPYQNGSISAEYILKDYGKEVFSVLDALFKLYTTGFKNIEEEAENIRKMFVAIAKDVRTILIIICYVLADVLTIDEFSPEIQKARCKMVLDIYAPLASRLGLSTIKSDLEDTCFAVLEPKISKQIYDSVESRYHAREKDVELIKNKLKNLVAELQMKAEITGRKKHTYSIYKKIRDKTHS
ncbi:MAG: HD domain-containing protein, partial [Clostridia bacterium]|nr:HD domain-containing protein [Clostridia bacterium]